MWALSRGAALRSALCIASHLIGSDLVPTGLGDTGGKASNVDLMSLERAWGPHRRGSSSEFCSTSSPSKHFKVDITWLSWGIFGDVGSPRRSFGFIA